MSQEQGQSFADHFAISLGPKRLVLSENQKNRAKKMTERGDATQHVSSARKTEGKRREETTARKETTVIELALHHGAFDTRGCGGSGLPVHGVFVDTSHTQGSAQHLRGRQICSPSARPKVCCSDNAAHVLELLWL